MKLAPAIHYMAKNGLHRLWILGEHKFLFSVYLEINPLPLVNVDDDRKPTGVVTLLDIMKALMVVSKGSFRDWQRRMSNAPDERPVGLSL
jgi:CBS domain-containing protein